ncbi:ABC transporter permease [Elioraea sp.]|uniref:ABC transporter permease n=1 Tax=Elioraea sp. TaxID=2185103 RepID=UPI003F6ED914
MARFLLRRIGQSVLVLFIVLTFVFVAGRMIGDPAVLLLGPEASAADILRVRRQMGLEEPLLEQFLRFMSGVVTGDFGVTFRYGFAVPDVAHPGATGTPVMPLVLERLPATYLLATTAMLFATGIAVLLGCVAAMHPRSALDRGITVVAPAGVSVVDFWLGFMLILLFGVQFGWLPTSGFGGPAHLVLPALTLAVRPIGRIAQLVRSAMLDELGKPYVDAARAKGFSEPRIVFGHALKNASIPVTTMIGDELLQIVQGAIVVEVVFAWPGIGSLLVHALSTRDLPLVEAAIFVLAVTAITVNLAVDLVYTVLDPRVRFR